MGISATVNGEIQINKDDHVSLRKICENQAYYEISILILKTVSKREFYIHKVAITFWNTYGEQATERLTRFLQETKAIKYDLTLESRFIK